MKIINFTVLILTGLYMLSSCSQPESGLKTSGGFEYQYIVDAPGDLAREGQYVYFSMYILDDKENLIQSYPAENLQPSFEVPGDDPIALKQNPILDLLKKCSVGDSVSLRIPRDSIPQLPQEYADIAYLEYRIKVKDLLEKEDYQSEMAIIQERQMAKQQEVHDQLEATIESYTNGSLAAELQKTPGGLEYIVHEKGEGPMPVENEPVSVHYYGVLLDGTSFDNSFQKGVPYTFTLGRGEVIRGWDVGVALLNEGSKATLFVPSEMAYGERGNPPAIPPNSNLAFYVEISKVR